MDRLSNNFIAYVRLWFSLYPLIFPYAHADCGQPATLISEIQGSGNKSPHIGEIHSIEAIVTGDFQSSNKLGGFFVQEEIRDQDQNPSSSEGLFVYHRDPNVTQGQLVRVTGTVKERFGMTQMTKISQVQVCAKDPSATVVHTDLSLPIPDNTNLEAYEGMLIRIGNNAVITDNLNLERFGEFSITGIKRLFNPTQIVPPGENANRMSVFNQKNRLIIDDGSYKQYVSRIDNAGADTLPFYTLRAGQRVISILGVLSYGYKAYRVHPIEKVVIDKQPRSNKLVLDSEVLRLASFNVNNFFNGDGLGNGFPTSRGADSKSEFQRQRTKLGHAIVGLNAHIIGIAELENDGYSKFSALASLCKASNALSTTRYDYIRAGTERWGDDVISVGLLYQADRVTAIGNATAFISPVSDKFKRKAMAQLFQIKDSNIPILIIMNHFKSKNCTGANGTDADQHDGQSCFNAYRTKSAQTLIRWTKNQTLSRYVALLGDFNSYPKEDPIQTILKAGYHHGLNDEDYSYVYRGQAGTLDYTFSSAALAPFIKHAGHWHINADEPRYLDYNTGHKAAGFAKRLYQEDPYRSSDHDPAYIDISLRLLKNASFATVDKAQ